MWNFESVWIFQNTRSEEEGKKQGKEKKDEEQRSDRRRRVRSPHPEDRIQIEQKLCG
jgi:hypothetical protein